jgi:hypothetical protein
LQFVVTNIPNATNEGTEGRSKITRHTASVNRKADLIEDQYKAL